MKALSRLRIWDWPLAVKFTIGITLMVTLAVVSVTLASLRRERQSFRTELEQQALLSLELIEEVSSNMLYQLDADSLQEIVEEVDESGLMLAGRIYDAEGRLVADSSDINELVFQIDPDPYGQTLLTQETDSYEWLSDRLRAGRAIIFGNQTIGAISVEFPTKPLDDKITNVRNQGLIIAFATIAVGIGLALVLSRSITGPLEDLVAAAQQLAAGDATYIKQPAPGDIQATTTVPAVAVAESFAAPPAKSPAVQSAQSPPENVAPANVITPTTGTAPAVTITTQDEIGKLATVFNEMVEAVQQRERQLREQAENLRVANQRAEEASRLKSEFLASISHELRTPLNVILGFSDMLIMGMDGEINEKQEFKLTRLRENGARLLSLINDILDLSRLEAKRVELVNKPFAPQALADRLAAHISILAAKKELTFEYTVAADLPATIISDEKRIEQIAVNLLSNAVKFTENGTVTLTLCANASDQHWQISVKDTGIGIPPHALDLIFDEFRQVDGSPTRAYAGSGLGLAISRNLALLMDGDISVQSKLGEGSTFTVKLPLITPPPQTNKPEESATTEAA